MTSYFDLLKGDALERLKSVPSNSVHAVITDPPYGLTAGHDTPTMMKCWVEGKTYFNHKTGYAGTSWDSTTPQPELFQEVARVLMPGGFFLAFGATRTIHLTAVSLEFAGLEIRDTLNWVYAPGCQRSKDLSTYDELKNSPNEKRMLEGRRPTLRPGFELITVARKKLYENQNLLGSVQKYGIGAINHNAFLDKPNRVATNVLAVHDLDCDKLACLCGVSTNPATKYATPIFPKSEISFPSLQVAKPKSSERPKSADGTFHETVKPVALMRTLIRAFSAPGQIILDPYLGSGTTAEAALIEGRHIVGCEITPKYWELIESRFNSLEMRGFDVRQGSPFSLQSTSVLSNNMAAPSI